MSNAQDIVSDPSCMDDFDPNSLAFDQALARIETSIESIKTTTRVPIRDALSRVLGADVTANIDVPNRDNAAMDGYAVNAADVPQSGVATLALVGSSFAGHPWTEQLQRGQCVRIMTGAVIPDGSDCVIMQEDVERDQDQVRIGSGHSSGQFVRTRGDDVEAGMVVLSAGKQLTPADLGLLATVGVSEVEVVRRPRVAFMSTGDELRSVGDALGPGDVYDSNRYALFGMLSRLGVELLDFGVIKDDRDAVRSAFEDASKDADAVIVSGGASVGDADFVHEILNEIGQVEFWKMAMKPGRPLAYGRIGDALFFGLPGNPVSVIVTFYQFVTPALKRLMGMPARRAFRLRLPLAQDLRKRPGRLEFQRGIVERREDGSEQVSMAGGQGSHILSAMSRANCFIVLPLECGDLKAGELVEVELFDGLV